MGVEDTVLVTPYKVSIAKYQYHSLIFSNKYLIRSIHYLLARYLSSCTWYIRTTILPSHYTRFPSSPSSVVRVLFLLSQNPLREPCVMDE